MSNKKIIFKAIDNGIEGKEKDRVVFASFDENEVKEWIKKSPNKNWLRFGEEIVDVITRREEVLKKMDGINKLVLGLV